MHNWKKYILNRGEESTSIAALVFFKLRYFLIHWNFPLENNKIFSVDTNSKLNCVGWTIAFLSRPLLSTLVTWPKAVFSKILIQEKKPIATFTALPEKPFQAPKIIFKSPSLFARSRCHMSAFWKTKDWSSHFWDSQPFRFWYVEVHHQRILRWKKIGTSS